eukprot:jgi/Undpi1/11421/HiC_scaffold_30.g13718.m1
MLSTSARRLLRVRVGTAAPQLQLRGISSNAAAERRQKLVILGTGWGGFRLAREVNKERYDVTVVSPRNHFLFTPLLPSTTVGTLEFRCIQEPVRTIKGLHYLQAHCTGVDFVSKSLRCREVFKGTEHDLEYDYLVIATGAKNNTFDVPGVSEENNVFFLKQLGDARNIRNRLLECFERAASPYISDKERTRLLSFVVVGGGPTSIEYAAELHDFLTTDVKRWYPDLLNKVIFTLPFGLMVWSTGLAPIDLVRDMEGVKKERGRIAIDRRLRVPGMEGVFAMGDAAVDPESPLGPLAQVADQQGKVREHIVPFVTFGYPSIANKALIPMHWFKAWAFGRDISRF